VVNEYIHLSFGFNISFDSPDLEHVADLSYSKLMKQAGCSTENDCILHCLFNYNHQQIEQTLFLTRPKNYSLYDPNLHIENIQQISPTEFNITSDFFCSNKD
jgi:hypothetical protein